MPEVVIVDAVRTPIGKLQGVLSEIPAHKLGSRLIAALLERTGVKKEAIDEVILGQVLTAGIGMNAARQAAMDAGLCKEAPAWGLNQVCGSGLKAVVLAMQQIERGDSSIVIPFARAR